jgi:hypothetical protein
VTDWREPANVDRLPIGASLTRSTEMIGDIPGALPVGFVLY